jgi:hypothetical protein
MTFILSGSVFLLKSDIMLSQIAFLSEYQAPGLKRWGESFISTFLFQTHPFITISAIISFYFAIKRRDVKFIIISWLIILVLLLQIRRSRYVMVIFPMFTLMASYGLCCLKSSDLKRYIVTSIAAFSLIVAVFAYLPFLRTMSEENLHSAGTYLNTIDAPFIRVITIPSETSVANPAVSVPVLDLYTHKRIGYQYDARTVPPLEKIQESPLRFTWEYTNPGYYQTSIPVDNVYRAVAVISNGKDELPDNVNEELNGYEQKIIFNTTTGIFRYDPVVRIFQPAEIPQ